MNQIEFSMILLKYQAGLCTDAECSKVELWYKNLQSPKEITDPVKSKFQIFKNILAALRKDGSHWPSPGTCMAGAILTGASLPPPPPPPANSSQLTKEESVEANEEATPIINKTSPPQLLTLPDGTKITLEPERRLSIVNSTQSGGQVRWQGKAFFDIASLAHVPVLVYTENLVIRMPDTGFTINTARVEGEIVEMKTGRVAVFTKEKKSNSTTQYVTTTPALQLAYNKVCRELISPVVKHLHMVVPSLVGLYAKSHSNETSSFSFQYEETPVSKILNAIAEACCMKIIFDQNKLSFCLLKVNLKEKDLFTRFQYATPWAVLVRWQALS